MDVGKSFSFVVDDKDWAVKILIGAGILLVGILFSWVLLIPLIAAVALLCGYSLSITRRVIRGDAQLLPDWKEWRTFIADGLRVIIVVIVYALPMIVVSVLVGVPAGLLQDSSSHATLAVGEFLSVITTLVSIAWGIVMSFLLPAAIGLLADHENLVAAFRFGDVFGLVRSNFSTYLVTVLMGWVAALVGGLGKLACGIGWLATMPYSTMVTGHLYGQAYLIARSRSA
jgi:hypothetical protein